MVYEIMGKWLYGHQDHVHHGNHIETESAKVDHQKNRTVPANVEPNHFSKEAFMDGAFTSYRKKRNFTLSDLISQSFNN